MPSVFISEFCVADDHLSNGQRWRQYRRIPVILPAKMETPRGCFESVILDMSLGGARGWLNVPIGLQEDTTLAFEKFGRLPGEILCVTRQRNRRFEFRLRFTLDSKAIAQRFSGYLSSSPDSLHARVAEERALKTQPTTTGYPAPIHVH